MANRSILFTVYKTPFRMFGEGRDAAKVSVKEFNISSIQRER